MIIKFESVKHTLGNNHFYYNFQTNSSITGVFGPSGAGKTTLFNLLSGVDTPLKGKIKLDSEILVDISQNHVIQGKNRDIGYVFQENHLFPHLSVKKNLLYSKPYIKNKTQYISFDDVVSLLDIAPLLKKKPRQLSGGERQRVAIGRTLLSQPRLLLLDEPFSNVDCSKRKQIISYLLRINNHFQIPMVIISHHLEDILKLTRKIVIIENGQSTAADDIFNIIKNGEKPELIRSKKYQNTFEVAFNSCSKTENTYSVLFDKNTEIKISNHSKLLNENIDIGTRIQLSLRPIDIALSLEEHEGTSIQNQLKGIVKQIIQNYEGVFCIVDCGFELFVEISQGIINNLYLHEGQKIYCQIKANDFDVVHVFDRIEKDEKQYNLTDKHRKDIAVALKY
ncbi:MAG: molybdenum ABC transporter ATP-binding protein [Bacteroidales bacterium]|jgi:molybdate transport system ATP-binding protein|nr:molybdenum ABC transporter ATP-binding protein [Bacteroidales bacterium]